MDKRSIIITGSGRSGTYNLHEFLKNFSNYTVHHELYFNEMLKAGVLSHEGESASAHYRELMDSYLCSMVQKNLISVDVSNAPIWCINQLNARHQHMEWHMVVRNGYKVVSSFYYKFKHLMYPESKIISSYLAFKNKNFDHPLDKTFWRPLPHEEAFYEKYESNLRFAIICWYWTETLKQYEQNESLFDGFYRFEDLVSGAELERLCGCLGIDYSAGPMCNFFKRPTNIESRVNHQFSFEQNKIFDEICGEYMHKYYSDMRYYDVKY